MDYRRQKVTSLSPVSAARQALLTLSLSRSLRTASNDNEFTDTRECSF